MISFNQNTIIFNIGSHTTKYGFINDEQPKNIITLFGSPKYSEFIIDEYKKQLREFYIKEEAKNLKGIFSIDPFYILPYM